MLRCRRRGLSIGVKFPIVGKVAEGIQVESMQFDEGASAEIKTNLGIDTPHMNSIINPFNVCFAYSINPSESL